MIKTLLSAKSTYQDKDETNLRNEVMEKTKIIS